MKQKGNAMKRKTKPAVGYVRMSTDQQQDSPQRQRRDVKALADRLGYRIIQWYEDHGLTGTESTNRPKFQRLLKDAKNGKFDVVLVSEQSRMSREDIFDAMLHWRLLRDAGVKVVTCQRGELDFSNLGGVITAIVDQYGAHEESVKLAQRVVSGQRLCASQGKRIGGLVFGYDREVLDEAGKVVRRVHFRERFRKPRSWTTRLAPSADRAAVKAVRWAFDAIRKGQTVGAIVREFNNRGLTTVYDNPFDFTAVKGILINPTYAGIQRAGTYSRGKFYSLSDEGIITVENAHEAIVDPEVFEEVSQILARRKRTYCPRSLYLLSGLVACIHCRRNMSGVHRKVGSNSKRKERYYMYGPDQSKRGCDKGCSHPTVRIERLEGFVLDAVRTHLLDTGAEERIHKAIVRMRSKNATKTSRDEKRLQEIRRKIERGTENLALAAKQDFTGISKLLDKWREEEVAILERIEQRRGALEPLPEALLPGKVIEIPDEAIGRRKIWREIGELAREADEPLHLADIAEYIGTPDLSHACYHMRQATRAGVVRKIGWLGGWVATG